MSLIRWYNFFYKQKYKQYHLAKTLTIPKEIAYDIEHNSTPKEFILRAVKAYISRKLKFLEIQFVVHPDPIFSRLAGHTFYQESAELDNNKKINEVISIESE